MNLAYYNRFESKMSNIADMAFVRIAYLYSNKLNICSYNYKPLFLDTKYPQRLSDEDYIEQLNYIRKLNGMPEDNIMLDQLKFIRKCKHNKIHNIEVNDVIRNYNRNISNLKNIFQENTKALIEDMKLNDMASIYLEENSPITINQTVNLHLYDDFNDDIFPELINNFLSNDEILILDESLLEKVEKSAEEPPEKILNYMQYNINSMFKFPLLHGFSYDLMKSIKQYMATEFDEFNKNFSDFKNKVCGLPFVLKESGQYIEDFINLHCEKLQTHIDSNIYIQKQINAYNKNDVVEVYLCISSYRDLIYLLGKLNIMYAHVCDHFIELLSKNLNVDNNVLFIIHKMPEATKDIYTPLSYCNTNN